MKKLFIGIVVLCGLLVIGAVLLPFVIDLNRYKAQFLPFVEDALGRKVSVGDIRLTIVSGLGAEVRKVTVMDDPAFSTAPFLALDAFQIQVRVLPLLSGRVEVKGVTFQRPRLALVKRHDGIWNVSTLGRAKGKAPAAARKEAQKGKEFSLALFSVDRLSVKQGRITVVTQSASGGAAAGSQAASGADHLDVTILNVSLGKTATLQVSMVLQPWQEAVTLSGKMMPGDITVVDSLLATLPEGQVVISARADLTRDSLPFAVDLSADRFHLGPLLTKITAEQNVPSGTARMSLSLQGDARAHGDISWEVISPTLRGKGDFSVTDGDLGHVTLLEEILRATTALGVLKTASRSATYFSAFTGAFTIAQEQVTFSQIAMAHPDYDIELTGTAGLDRSLSLTGQVLLSPEISRQIQGPLITSFTSRNSRLVIPLRIAGSVDAPKVSLDMKRAGKTTTRQLKEKLLDVIRPGR